MESVREKNGGLSSNRLIGEPLGAENPMRTFEPHVKIEEKKHVTSKADLAEEIKRPPFRIRYNRNRVSRKRNSAAFESSAEKFGSTYRHTAEPLRVSNDSQQPRIHI